MKGGVLTWLTRLVMTAFPAVPAQLPARWRRSARVQSIMRSTQRNASSAAPALPAARYPQSRLRDGRPLLTGASGGVCVYGGFLHTHWGSTGRARRLRSRRGGHRRWFPHLMYGQMHCGAWSCRIAALQRGRCRAPARGIDYVEKDFGPRGLEAGKGPGVSLRPRAEGEATAPYRHHHGRQRTLGGGQGPHPHSGAPCGRRDAARHLACLRRSRQRGAAGLRVRDRRCISS